uniref:Uncharacterized protein n=1 Tax=Anguilla anguilla TaxID=7936 RepID=A0A0E9SY47_ANGAN
MKAKRILKWLNCPMVVAETDMHLAISGMRP